MIKVVSFKKIRGGKKKYEIIFNKNGKKYVRKFGAAGMSDFTIHKDNERRERYISRHKKDLKTNDPMRPGYLSMYILWNKRTIKASLSDYKRRLNIYNRTGKFPKVIKGSKILKYGTIPFEKTSMREFPTDIQDKIQKEVSASDIQRKYKKYKNTKNYLLNILKKRGLERYKMLAKETDRPEENRHFVNQLWTNLDPINKFTADWLTQASKILTKKDVDFVKRNFWWKVIDDMLSVMTEIEDTDDLTEDEYYNFIKSSDALIVIMEKFGYEYGTDEDALRFWRSKRKN